MENTNKVQYVVFGILIIAVLGEVAFLLFTNKPSFTKTQEKTGQVVTPEPKKIELNKSDDQAIKPEVLDTLANLKRDILTSSVLRNDFDGIVTKVERDNGLKLYLKGSKNTNNLFFTPEEIAEVKVQKYSAGTEPIPASIDDIAPGQTLLIQQNMDLLGDLTKSTTELRILIYTSK